MEINQYVFLQLILSSIPLIDILDSHGLVLWLCFLAWKTNRIYHLWIIIHYIFQGHFGSYGIDWEGPIPDCRSAQHIMSFNRWSSKPFGKIKQFIPPGRIRIIHQYYKPNIGWLYIITCTVFTTLPHLNVI